MILKANIKEIKLINHIMGKTILENIDFEINTGSVYTILGKNGSGKSTLIKSLTKLLDSKSYSVDGFVFFNDENIFLMNDERLLQLRQKEVRYVLQDLTNNFDPLKKLKYYFPKYEPTEDQISIQLKEYLLPDYKTISELHPYEISGGMAQRLSLMLALLPNPKLVILDEPTSAVDYTNTNLIKLKLNDFTKNNGSVLIVTHDIMFAKEISDKIAFLENGVLSELVPKDLFFSNANKNVYSEFIKSYNMIV